MDKKIKSLLLKALTSGKFKQAQSVLCDKTPSGKIKGYCCLGVLCVVQGAKFDKEGHPFVGKVRGDSTARLDYGPFTAGLSFSGMQEMINMNDDGKTFKQIAAWVRKNIKGETAKKND